MISVSHVVGFEENVGGDSDEIAVQLSLVPSAVDVRQLPVGKAAGVLEQETGFGDQLHVAYSMPL